MLRSKHLAKDLSPGSLPLRPWAEHVRRRLVTLELGGKSSAIVLEDADLDDLSARLIRSCIRNIRQTCYISIRILAPAPRYDGVMGIATDTIAGRRSGI